MSFGRDDAYRQEIISALDSRLKSKSPKTVSHAITLLDTLEKNCFGPFHRLVCQKEFLDNLFRIAMKEQVKTSVCSFIAESRKQPSCGRSDSISRSFVRLYRKGIQTLWHSLSFSAEPRSGVPRRGIC